MAQAHSVKQAMTPKEILRWNFASLKEELHHPEDLIDDLWSAHVFSDADRRICKEQDGRRAQTAMLLELVMKRGDKVYEDFCAVLHNTHDHLKVMLDETAKRGCSRETEVQICVSEMKQKIADLQKERDDARQEVQHTKAKHERVVSKTNTKHQEEKTNLQKEIKQLNTKLKSGHKALRELVAVFGEDSTSDKDIDDTNTVPTLTEMQSQHDISKDQEKAFETEKKRTQEAVAFLADHMKTRGIYFLDAGKVDLSSILHCIPLKYDTNRVNLNKVQINTEGDLANKKSDTRPTEEGRLKHFWGTCSTIPLPKDGCLQYWETETRVGLDKQPPGNTVILEVGVCAEEEMDKTHCVGDQPHACSLTVNRCTKHEEICIKTVKAGKVVLNLPDTIPNTAGTSHTLHYGVVYDDIRKKIVFIDVKEKKVMSTFNNVDSSQPLWPMFGVYNPRYLTVSMRLVVGSDINMTEEKKTMIIQALA